MQYTHHKKALHSRRYEFTPSVEIEDYFIADQIEDQAEITAELKALTDQYGNCGNGFGGDGSGRWMYSFQWKIDTPSKTRLFKLEVVFRDPNDAVEFKLTRC